ncbi:alpha/beta hydrolase [Pradoshia sp. D12]|uniref:alpha/beta hydrolase n=1 Tax=Bacillaceae TaxID=186817 RepID=UPI001121DFC2|nr:MULTISPECIES: alpha/beta hydrolase [Bacillaceae]QFK70760.1 alpha/beta hydrolase [Pradoshia sp. D12]TPF72552.1 alpha/beta hydrolase [Bacillus sp. D12]
MRDYFIKGTNMKLPTLFMLHGTGGTEHDLVPIAKLISPESSILSVRGNVSENGMPRFFKRLAEGIFDVEDLKFRTKELNDYLNEASVKYGFDRNNVLAIGYSNGANIAASMLFHYQHVLKGAILHHPMVPLRGIKLPEMERLPIFIGAGKNDPICSPEETKELSEILKAAGAKVEVYWEQNGHQLTQSEVEAAGLWFSQQFK